MDADVVYGCLTRQQHINALARARYAANPEPWLRRQREYKATHPERVREAARKARRARSGIIDATGEPPKHAACPICNKVKRLVCDHDHETGRTRGWICYTCNVFLGPVDDGRVARAAAYLKGELCK